MTDGSGNLTSMTYDNAGRKISMTDPDMGTWSYGYDVNGNLTQQNDAKGQSITLCYVLLKIILTNNDHNVISMKESNENILHMFIEPLSYVGM